MNYPGGLEDLHDFYWPQGACDKATPIYNYQFRRGEHRLLWGVRVLTSLEKKQ